MRPPFPHPERQWHAQRRQVARIADIQQRLQGPVVGPIRALGGGLANDNILLGDDRVLCIYRRDVKRLSLEASLLSLPWENFRVPRLLDRGADFLLLEYVPHCPLDGSADAGRLVGRALTEIQQHAFPSAGQIDASLQLVERWPDFFQVMVDYIRQQQPDSEEGQSLLVAAAAWLSQRREWLATVDESPALLHGDFKASNLHFASGGALLVLDWEFAYAGPKWMDVGQLFRWDAPASFRLGFERAFSPSKRNDWYAVAQAFDVVNLVGGLTQAKRGSQQFVDCRDRLRYRLGCA